jgi:hypothetical protein
LFIRARSLAGIERRARCAELASRKSQLTLKVFEAHGLALRVLPFCPTYGIDFVGLRRLYPHCVGAVRAGAGHVVPKRLPQEFRAGAMFVAADTIKLIHHFRWERDRDRFRGSLAHGSVLLGLTHSHKTWPGLARTVGSGSLV